MPERTRKSSSGYRTLEIGQPPIFLYFCEGRILTRLYFTTHSCCFLVNDSEGKKGNTDLLLISVITILQPSSKKDPLNYQGPPGKHMTQTNGRLRNPTGGHQPDSVLQALCPSAFRRGGIHDSRREMDKSIDLQGHLHTLRLSLDFGGRG